ncbi:MAG: class I tRNA ligase family protein, partial [Fimbriimonas ginsengisoli]|nr:class I tRNA ligase family protein [Fimbriimonas ginsengisoli]
GEDLVFPHHECEIAQSECLTGKPFCNHWVHTRFLQVEGEKMSKSEGNFYSVRDLVDEMGADPLAVRYALIAGVYGKPMNFTLQGLRDAAGNIERFQQCDAWAVKALAKGPFGPDELGPTLDGLYEECLVAMCDDLNTAVALAKALEGTRAILREGEAMSKASAASARAFLDKTNGLLGIVRPESPGCTPKAPGVDEGRILALIEERGEAKKGRDFARADAIRSQLESEGIELRDGPEGTTWRRRV